MSQPPSGAIRAEAEDGRLTGTAVAASGTGFSGRGYVTGFDADGDRVEVTLVAPKDGVYSLRLGFRTPSGPKGFAVRVNGSAGTSGMFPETGPGKFAVHEAGKVDLKRGENAVAVEKGWGYYDLDFVEAAPAPPPARLVRPPLRPADRAATPAARALLAYLIDRYGNVTLSGQQEIADAAYVRKTVGVLPAVVAGDFMDYSPSRVARGADPKGATEKMIAQARAGAIVSMSWHWNAPTHLLDRMIRDAAGKEVDARWYKGFYTNATTFDVAKTLASPRSEEYRLLLRDIDAVAKELKKFSAANVPVLWRPLHEAEGRWFWWGAKGPEPFKKLWRLMFDRLTRHHGLHNLLWVYTAGGDAAWYPGDDVVDIVGHDAYPQDSGDPLTGIWETLLRQYGGRKLLALTEFGKVPDVARMRRFGVRWSYFVSWTGTLGPKGMSAADLKRLYAAPGVQNRDKTRLPAAAKPR